MKYSVIVYFKNGTNMPAKWFNNSGCGMYDFSLDIDGEERVFLYIDTSIRNEPDRPKWRERDYKKEKQMGESGYYKVATLDFDRIEVSYTLE